MEVKPPIAIATVVVLIVLLFGAYKIYERGRSGAAANPHRMTMQEYEAARKKSMGQ